MDTVFINHLVIIDVSYTSQTELGADIKRQVWDGVSNTNLAFFG